MEGCWWTFNIFNLGIHFIFRFIISQHMFGNIYVSLRILNIYHKTHLMVRLIQVTHLFA